MIPSSQVTATDARLKVLRSRRHDATSDNVDEVLQGCERSHTSGDGSKAKVRGDKFDIMGVAVLVCRHDNVLFWADVNSAGEGQQYAVTLLEALFAELPRNATVLALYDVGCLLARSQNRVRMAVHLVNT